MNLIITSAKGLEAKASAEFKEIALLHGFRKFRIEKSPYDGILEIEVENPKEVVSILREYVRSEPFRIRFILRVLPVDLVVDTKMAEIKKSVKQLSSAIGKGEKFRVTIEARDSPYSNSELIDAVAEQINQKVDLESPDKIVLLEIFGEYTAISVCPPEDMLSIVKLKRGC
jgi:tRNA acetyltransferase TAN1